MSAGNNNLEQQLFTKSYHVYQPEIAFEPIKSCEHLGSIVFYGLSLSPISQVKFYSDKFFKLTRSSQLLSKSQAIAMLLRACREYKDSNTAKSFFARALKLSQADASNILHLPEVASAISILLSTKIDQHGAPSVN